MILVPAIEETATTRRYADSSDQQLFYLDALQPAPMQGSEVARWLPMPPHSAYLAGEVRFGPGSEELEQTPHPCATRHPSPVRGRGAGGEGIRLVPVAWDPSLVYVWLARGDEVRLLTRGKTSGYGAANAVLNANTSADAMLARLALAAELRCTVKLAATLRGTGNEVAVLSAIAEAELGKRAMWHATLTDAIIASLRPLLGTALTLEIEATDAARAELETMALTEWAHRLAPAYAADKETLASPAALLERLEAPPQLDLRIDWPRGTVATLRSVRTLVSDGALPVAEVG